MCKQELIERIGEFYYKNYKSNYQEIITKTGFVGIYLDGDTVIFIVKRPGIFIGQKGENITKLAKHLGYKIEVIEDDEETLTDKLISEAALCDYGHSDVY